MVVRMSAESTSSLGHYLEVVCFGGQQQTPAVA
jgi:hypothetical protein